MPNCQCNDGQTSEWIGPTVGQLCVAKPMQYYQAMQMRKSAGLCRLQGIHLKDRFELSQNGGAQIMADRYAS